MRGIVMSIHWGAPLPLLLFRFGFLLALDRGENPDDRVVEFHNAPLAIGCACRSATQRRRVADDPSKIA